VIARAINLFVGRPGFRRAWLRAWYDYLAYACPSDDWLFMNYGYAETQPDRPTPQLDARDEKERYCILLYHRLATEVDMAGRDVVEVGCGRGGGAAFVKRYFGPRSVIGIDYAFRAVGLCNSLHRMDGLTFCHGDATRLPIRDASADIVLSVESLQSFWSPERFFHEGARVLCAGGQLLIATFQPEGALDRLAPSWRRAGLVLDHADDISDQVQTAMMLENERKITLMRKALPRVLWPIGYAFAAVRGTRIHEALCRGTTRYFIVVLRKPAAAARGMSRPMLKR
jgi:ubiquinone/menaquinone biosynthesis C-methylase UbiE